MAERWRQPVVPLDVEQQRDQGVWLPDGRVLGGVTLTLSAGDVERMRLGRVCAKCLEPFEQAWPERCHVCGAAIARDQADYFAREFAGAEQLGPSTSIDDEIALMHEERAREEREHE